MAGAYKRPSDKARGKAGKWTMWFKDRHGRTRCRVGFTDKNQSIEMANHLEVEETKIREGMVDAGEQERKLAAQKPLAEHVADYCSYLEAKGDTPKHVKEAGLTLNSFLAEAGITNINGIEPGRVQKGLASRAQRFSARTTNKALGYVKAFAAWLFESNRTKDMPRGFKKIQRANQAEDRRWLRRAFTVPQLEKLLVAAEGGHDYRNRRVIFTGRDRAAVYRLAAGTGFRANEIRTLTPERFNLEGDSPTITVLACYAKNGKETVQPIAPELAEALKPFVEGKAPGQPVFPVPRETAEMIRVDLDAAGIQFRDSERRVLDFHSLRNTFISHLVAGGANIHIVKQLARHSTITLTMDLYCRSEDADMRAALQSKKQTG